MECRPIAVLSIILEVIDPLTRVLGGAPREDCRARTGLTEIAGLDNEGLEIDRLDIAGLDNDGRIWVIDFNQLKLSIGHSYRLTVM